MTRPVVDQQLEQLRDELRAEIREARETIKDLRAEIKDARTLIPLLTDELFEAEVKKRVDALGDETRKAMDESVARVYASFDEITKTLLGESGKQRRTGQPTLTEIADATHILKTAARHGGTP